MGDCRKFLRGPLGQARGFSMIEVMIAGGLIAFIAVAILPGVFSVMDTSKATGFKAQCAGAVRAKLQEYVNGVADNTLDSSANYSPTGFEYTKKRYQTYGQAVCSSTVANTGVPGFREAVYGNSWLANQAAQEVQPGSNIAAVMPGFQLWVMIRRYNPRKLVNSTGAVDALHGTPVRDCPANTYQFFSLGDALEVTVTGMVRTDTNRGQGGRGCTPVGKLYDLGHTPGCNPGGTAPNPLLTCSASEIVYPPRLPFRYYLSGDGKIRNYQASIAFNSGGSIQSSKQAMESHFRSVWVQKTNNPAYDNSVEYASVTANIRSFAVSPDNQWVYVLRPGELSRYGPCYDNQTSIMVNGVPTQIGGPVTVSLDATNNTQLTYNGTPDCPAVPSVTYNLTTPAVDGKTWSISPNIESIAVDFGSNLDDPSDDKVYGMLSTGSTFSGGNSGLVQLNLYPIVGGAPYSATYTESSAFTLPTNRPRIRGMFISQTFPSTTNSNGSASGTNLFFFDNTCYTSSAAAVTSSSFCASIFNAADTNSQQSMRELPMQVEGISY